MAKPGVTVISSFTYRGTTEEFSNQFHFTGSAPTTTADWNNLCSEFVTLFKPLVFGVITIVRVYCYTDTDNDAVYTYNLADHGGTVTGTLASSGGIICPGDAAYWVRWATGRTNTKGKPVYLRKYFHGAYRDSTVWDVFLGTAKAAAQTAAATLAAAGTHWPGMAGPTYDLPASPAVLASTYVTTRTLKRRGKRP